MRKGMVIKFRKENEDYFETVSLISEESREKN